MEQNGVLYTPQLGSILPGITRTTIIELCEESGIRVVEKQITPEELKSAESAFYCGTAAEVIGIASVDKAIFPKPWSQSLGAVLQKAYKQLVLDKDHLKALNVA